MSSYSTRYITRYEAIAAIASALGTLSNNALAEVLDTLSDTAECENVSQFDRFVVTD